MKDSELFKKLNFHGENLQKDSETAWIRKLDAIENAVLLQNQKHPFPNQDELNDLEDKIQESFPRDTGTAPNYPHKSFYFKLELDPHAIAPQLSPQTEELQAYSCVLQLFQELSGTPLDTYTQSSLHAITTWETLEVLQSQENQTDESDRKWLQILAPFFIIHPQHGELRILLPELVQAKILKELCLQRLLISFHPKLEFFQWADFETEFLLQLRNDSSTDPERWKLWGSFKTSLASKAPIDLWEIQSATQGGIARQGKWLFSFCTNPQKGPSIYPWIQCLLTGGAIHFQKFALKEFLYRGFSLLDPKNLELPENIHLTFIPAPTLPIFYVKTQLKKHLVKTQIEGFVWFRIDFNHQNAIEASSSFEYPAEIHKDIGTHRQPKVLKVHSDFHRSKEEFHISIWVPNREQECKWLEEIQKLVGIFLDPFQNSFRLRLAQATEIFYYLLNHGWEVWAENLQLKILKEFDIQITTQEDWLELNINTGKNTTRISAWQLIHLLKKQRMFIQLSDGTLGVLPEHWYREFERLFSLRNPDINSHSESDANETLRFSIAHAFHFEEMAKMASEDTSAKVNFRSDPLFEEIRRTILNLKGLKPSKASPSFQIVLRPYQELGLSWLNFLGKAHLGGCLADDMGLGKTIQLLAYLDQKHLETFGHFRTLIVCPKSLLEHWYHEAQRCSPKLRILILKTPEIVKLDSIIENFDLFLISYGLVRFHTLGLGKFRFDLLVLDEAQIIKNTTTQVNHSVRQLRGVQRLALTGTPIENHMGELLGLFEFLNPGITNPGLLKCATSNPDGNTFTHPVLTQFLRGIRPLLLRRLKKEVATELPEKSEQILILPMLERQESIYTSLKNYYKEHLIKLKKKELAQNQFYDQSFLLEGLLRLRQVSCHPGLLTKQTGPLSKLDIEDTADRVSNKLEFLLEKLKTLAAAEHKAVVFSQFTSLLKLFRQLLNSESIPYEYLDGQCQNRIEIVNRFQEDSTIPVLLAGIKTGGLGLNLTAADYCFILDPWWNPALEQQAVDRIHRIGQTKPVSIYRIVSQDTVEEKILVLQEKKQKIADQLMTANHDFLENLNFEDFQFLFS